MAKTEVFTCDGCGKQKGDVNRWWMLSEIADELILLPWNPARTSHRHYCGQSCVIKAVNEFLSKLRSDRE